MPAPPNPFSLPRSPEQTAQYKDLRAVEAPQIGLHRWLRSVMDQQPSLRGQSLRVVPLSRLKV